LVDLVSLAHHEELASLEQAWEAALRDPGKCDAYASALEALCERDMSSKALALGMAMVEALADRGRADEAMRLSETIVELGIHTEAVTRRWFELLEERFGEESWYPLLTELAGLAPESPTTETLREFARLRRYTKGHVLYHPAGWGPGIVEEFRGDTRELAIRFHSGRVQRVPLQSALDSMRPLAEDDLRAMVLVAGDELERLAKEQPAVLIRKAARLHRGTITSAEVKALLCPDVVPSKRWASFWKRAKAAAAVDPYLQVDGTTTRPVFSLRKKPLSLVDEARRAIELADALGEEVAICRSYLERCQEAELRTQILDVIQERIEATAKGQRSASHPHLLEGILLLESHQRTPPVSAADEVRAMLLGDDGTLRPEMFDHLATQDARDHAVDLLAEAFGERWAEMCIEAMPRFPISVVERTFDLLLQKGSREFLSGLWSKVAPYPRRHPMLTYLMGRAYADGMLAGLPGEPDDVTVGRVLLHLCRVLCAERAGNPHLGRLQTRLTSLLAGRRSFLARVVDVCDRDNLSSMLGIAERAGRDFPTEVSSPILRAVARRFPDLTEKPEKPFWENDVILVTKEGLEAKREEYRALVEDKIPANSKAIGAAAALGDLSENSEWEAAMEEQRNLTSRAAMMDADLRKARLLEQQPITDDVVCPGTSVTITELQTGRQRRLRILGPWDMSAEDVLNYRAPAAKPLLGCTVGEETEIPGTDGPVRVRIDAIEPCL
jgi:transcription elongation factor GreA